MPEELGRVGRAHARDVEVDLVQIDAPMIEHRRNDLLANRMVDEPGLEILEDLHHGFHRHGLMHLAWIEAIERLFDHLAGKLDQAQAVRVG